MEKETVYTEQVKYMPVKEYAKKFGVPIPTVYYHLRMGKLKGKKIGSYQLVQITK